MIAAALCRIAARSHLVAVLRSDTGRGDKARGFGPRWSWPVFSLGAATPILALAYGSRQAIVARHDLLARTSRIAKPRLATFNELTFSVLLIVGLATRMATLPLLGMIAVIQTFVYPQAWTEHLLWASILVFLLTRGPGELSLDYLVERWVLKQGRLLI